MEKNQKSARFVQGRFRKASRRSRDKGSAAPREDALAHDLPPTVLSSLELTLLILWTLACLALTYVQFFHYARLFLTHYGPRYFPALMRLL